jgi:hypothetical protein
VLSAVLIAKCPCGVYVADWLSKLRVKIWSDPSNRIRPRQVPQLICCVVVWLA